MIVLASATRYLGTYVVLLRHFAHSRGWRFGMMLAAVIASAVLHPMPFLLLAELLRSAQAGAADVSLGWRTFAIRMRPDTAVLAVFLVGSASFLISYAVSRLVNAETVAWQGRIFWQLTGDLARIARWDQSIDFGVRLRPPPLAGRLDGAIRGAFPIGRLVETGMRDAMMVLILVSVLIWQDAREMVVLGFLSLLFIPAYAMALSRLVRMQAKSNAGLTRLRQPVTSLLSSEVMRRVGRVYDQSAIPSPTTEALSQGYGSQSHLLNEQNAVTVVAGVHVFAAFYGVYLSEGRSLAALPTEKLAFFFFLVLMMRSLISLVGLLSRLSRGYERLGLLRSLLYPQAKQPLGPTPDAPIAFALVPHVTAGEQVVAPSVATEQTMVLLAPDVNFGFQLLPLANALHPRFAFASGPHAGLTGHIPLLRDADMPALIAGGRIAGEAELLRLAHAGPVPIRPEPLDLAKTPVVALTLAAWQRLVRTKMVAQANAGRLLVIAIAGGQALPTLPEGLVFVLSNGRHVVAAGDRATIIAAQAALAEGSTAAKPAAEDEEEAAAEF